MSQAVGTRACAAVLPAAGAAQAGEVSGIATHYVLQALPNCSYPSPPADGLFVALSPGEYDNAAACGGYLEVHGPDGSVRVEVIDQCPGCGAGHIDLSEAAFSAIAPLNAGLVDVTYQPLVNPSLPGPISLLVKQGSSQYWLALLAMNTGNPLASVQVRSESGGGWYSLVRASYNYWVAQSGAGTGPFTVRLTDTQGHVVTVQGIALSPGVVRAPGRGCTALARRRGQRRNPRARHHEHHTPAARWRPRRPATPLPAGPPVSRMPGWKSSARPHLLAPPPRADQDAGRAVS